MVRQAENQIERQPETTEQKIQAYASKVPPMYRNGYLKAATGKSSPRQAIKQKCLDCCCHQRSEVTECGIPTCTLYPFRPVFAASPAERAKPVSKQA